MPYSERPPTARFNPTTNSYELHPAYAHAQPAEAPRPTPPDLQKLVARFGRYDLIPAEAWAEWDAQNVVYQAAIRRRPE